MLRLVAARLLDGTELTDLTPPIVFDPSAASLSLTHYGSRELKQMWSKHSSGGERG